MTGRPVTHNLLQAAKIVGCIICSSLVTERCKYEDTKGQTASWSISGHARIKLGTFYRMGSFKYKSSTKNMKGLKKSIVFNFTVLKQAVSE